MMTSKFFLALAALLFSTGVFAQVSGDSINSLKQQKDALEVSTRINKNKIELAKLENMVEKKKQAVETTTTDAQKAADENNDAAAQLSSNPQDKSAAKKARKAAQGAERSAKKARSAKDDLADLGKDIDTLKGKIAQDESKLGALQGSGAQRN